MIQQLRLNNDESNHKENEISRANKRKIKNENEEIPFYFS